MNNKKKKNVYNVKVKGLLLDWRVFEEKDKMPLTVVSINGKKVEERSWNETVMFENPVAFETIRNFEQNIEIFGEKLASTIIVYNDKDTGEPVITLNPMLGVSHNDINVDIKRLNHEGRKDFFRQVERFKRIYERNMSKIAKK